MRQLQICSYYGEGNLKRKKARTPFKAASIDEPLQCECEEERLWRTHDSRGDAKLPALFLLETDSVASGHRSPSLPPGRALLIDGQGDGRRPLLHTRSHPLLSLKSSLQFCLANMTASVSFSFCVCVFVGFSCSINSIYR